MESIRTGSHRISTIVKSLRSFSRLDESKCKTVDIHHEINSTLSLLQHLINPDGDDPLIKVVKHYEPQAPMIECYPGALNQVFMTLLTNSIEAIRQQSTKQPSTPGKIEIQTVKQIDNSFLIRISDNGTGISEHILNKIFDPFFTTKPIEKRTGLGKGTTFTIELPLSQAA